jgi:hypothetical protein
METIHIEKDIVVMYVTASSFPEGIEAAHEQIHAIIPADAERRFFGISRPENGIIAYKAAAEELTPGEAEKYACPTLILKKGNYTCETIHDYKQDPTAIGTTFQRLLAHPQLDMQGYCVEWYIGGKDIKCMIRLRE